MLNNSEEKKYCDKKISATMKKDFALGQQQSCLGDTLEPGRSLLYQSPFCCSDGHHDQKQPRKKELIQAYSSSMLEAITAMEMAWQLKDEAG